MYDLLVRNGSILDGTGGPWFKADVAVVGDKIVEMGLLGGREAVRVIDATGHFVAPGFVEEHSHSDVTLIVDPLAQSAVRQGVTTLVVGNCGQSAAPVSEETRDTYRHTADVFAFEGYKWTWGSMGEYLDALRAAHPSVNVVSLVGHQPVRALATGGASRPANPEERAKMRALVEEALSEGARGFSTGLTYAHTVFADTDEIVEIAKALKPCGRAYCTHMRNQRGHLLDSIREAIEIAERAEVPLVISHLYPVGREFWGRAEAAIELLEDARHRGLEAGYDVTPWLRGGGPIGQGLPQWVREGGYESTLARLRDDDVRQRILAELEGDADSSFHRADFSDWLVCRVEKRRNRGWLGKSVDEIAQERNLPPAETVLVMLAEDNYWCAPTIKCDADVDMLIKHPLGVPVADGFALAPGDPLAYQDRPNSYGTFPRVLGRYVRERGVLTWEEAVHKMTSIPAGRMGLWDRGLLRPGMAADVVVFNPDAVIEKADYGQPQEYPEGIPWVIVNGRVTIAPEGHTGAQAGRVL